MLLLNFVVSGRDLFAHLLRRGELTCVPAATKGLNELHRRSHLIDLQNIERLLIAENRILRGNNIDVRIKAGLVALHFESKELLRRLHCLFLLQDLL